MVHSHCGGIDNGILLEGEMFEAYDDTITMPDHRRK